jgi:hypothetical protein
LIVPLEVARRIAEHKQVVIWRSGPKCIYQQGRCYVLQTKRKRPEPPHITITSVEQRQADSLSLRDARRLGFRTTADLIRSVARYDPLELIWLLGFELGDQTDSDRLPAARPGMPHGDYVSNGARALSGVGSEVSAHQQALYAARSEETYAQMLLERRKLREHRRIGLTNNLDRVFR